MSSASRWGIPWSRAFSRIASMKLPSRSWIVSGERMGPSSSRSWRMALKHSAVIWLTLSMRFPCLAGSGHDEHLDLHLVGPVGRRQVDDDRSLLGDLAPVLARCVHGEVGDAGADRDLLRRAVGHLD